MTKCLSTRTYDKRDDFYFDIVNFPFLDGDIPRDTSYCVYISNIICFAKASRQVSDVNNRNKILTVQLLKQGHRYHKLRKIFSKFYCCRSEFMFKYNLGLETLLHVGLSEPEFYVSLVYTFRNIVGKNVVFSGTS